MTEIIRGRYGYPGNGSQEAAFRQLSAQTRVVEVAVLPESNQIETRLYGPPTFDSKGSKGHLLFTASRKLPEEKPQFYIEPPETLFDRAWVDGGFVHQKDRAYQEDRAVLTALVLLGAIKEELPPEIPAELKVGAQIIEDPDQLRQSLISKRIIPFPLL